MLDVIETTIPLLVTSIHGILLLRDAFIDICSYSQHYFLLRGILTHFLLSVALKIAIRKKRICEGRWPVYYIPYAVKYGFPSSHSMFYFSYFLNNRSKISLLMAIVCPIIRISNGYHSVFEVLGSLILCCILKYASKNWDNRITDIEYKALNTLVKMIKLENILKPKIDCLKVDSFNGDHTL